MGASASLRACVEDELLNKREHHEGQYSLLDAFATARNEIDRLRAENQRLANAASTNATAVPPVFLARPPDAVGTVLRIATVNDVYKIGAYPKLASFLRLLRKTSEGCKVISCLSGDFLSPCVLSSLDGGKAMCEVLDTVPLDYVSFGNHEFDVGIERLKQRTQAFHGVWLNGNVTSPEFFDPRGTRLPEFNVVRVGDRSVVLSGFTTDNTEIYRPGCDASMEPIDAAMERVWHKAYEEMHKVPDAFLPMTHQTIEEDRQSADKLNKMKITDGCAPPTVPVVLGAHEHEVYVESVEKTLVVKVGCDAEAVGVCDVWWDAAGTLHRSCHLVPLDGFAPNAYLDDDAAQCPCAAFVAKQERMLVELLDTEIARLPEDGWSTKRVRFAPSKLASFLLQKVKRALAGVDCAVVQGGSVRGKSDYAAGRFTYEDLMREFAFDTEMAVVELPGAVLEDAVRETRTRGNGNEEPAFLQLDEDCLCDDAANLTHVAGAPLDRSKLYKVAILKYLLEGMNKVDTLVHYVRDSGLHVPDVEQCFPAKNLVVETCVREAWEKVLAANDGDVVKTFDAVDADKSGHIKADELVAYVDSLAKDDDPHNDVPVALVSRMLTFLDADADGNVTFQEFERLAPKSSSSK